MKLSEIVAELKSMKETLTGYLSDKTKATESAVAGFQSKLTALESGTAKELETATNALVEAKTTISNANAATEKAQGEVNALGGKLKAACAALKLEIKDGATNAEMIDALSNGVASTLAKLNVSAANIPNPAPTTASGKPAGKKMSLDEEIAARKQAAATK